MPTYSVHKSATVPGSFGPNELHFVAGTNALYTELYMSNSAGDALRRLLTEADVSAMITAAGSAGGAGGFIVDDIAARDALATPANGSTVYVLDASGDSTVTSGAATYIWDNPNTAYRKVSEAESLDLTIVHDWAELVNGPTSTVAAIDLAVTRSHVHANSAELDKIGEDGDGNITYDNSPIPLTLSSTDW